MITLSGNTMNKDLINRVLLLFHILPGDIVNYIFNILKRELAIETLIDFYHKRKLKFTCMDNFINNILFDNLTGVNNHLYRSVSENNIKNIETIIENNYKSYNIPFWQNILSLMSKNIMRANINCSLSMYYNFRYKKNINKIISLWLKLCKKFNIKFCITLKKNNNANNFIYETLYIHSKNIGKTDNIFRNFDKLLYAPSIIYTCTDWYHDENNFQYFNTIIDNDIAYRYLLRVLNNL